MHTTRSAGSLISPNRSQERGVLRNAALLPPDDRSNRRTLKLNHTVTADQLQSFDETISLAGSYRAFHLSTESIIRRFELSRRTARQSAGRQQSCHHGCGGIGFDTAMYLSQPGESTARISSGSVMNGGSTAACNRRWLKPAGNADPA